MTDRNLRFCLAQVKSGVGALEANTSMILKKVAQAEDAGAQIIIFPELVVTGYIPEDRLLHADFMRRVAKTQDGLADALRNSPLHIFLSYPRIGDTGLHISMGLLYRGRWLAEYDKHCLANDQVFDEERYFKAGTNSVICDIAGLKIGMSICEDIWHKDVAMDLAASGAHLIINASSSPFSVSKYKQRLQTISTCIKENNLPIFYVNAIGAQDELVYDGGSFVMNAQAKVCCQAGFFCEDLYMTDVDYSNPNNLKIQGQLVSIADENEQIYQALLLGLREYVQKNGFKGVVLGLSGGIDSALTLALAVDALGADAVLAVMMPSAYTSKMSIEDAALMAQTMKVRFSNISIESLRLAFSEALAKEFAGTKEDSSEENIQARCRGVLLMALSNKHDLLLLACGNKSELAMGYATLYGDMAGGFNPLKDVSKTRVYALARHRNNKSMVIPQRVIERPPTAELRPNQKDSDTLPDYALLDTVIEAYVERRLDLVEITKMGIDAKIAQSILTRIDANEYKRQQAAIGVRISDCSFGRRDRRYPVSYSAT